MRVPAGLQAPQYMEENRPIKLEYTVKVEKIYKGDDLLMPKSTAKIATAAIDAACGVTDLEVGQVYVLAGMFRHYLTVKQMSSYLHKISNCQF